MITSQCLVHLRVPLSGQVKEKDKIFKDLEPSLKSTQYMVTTTVKPAKVLWVSNVHIFA